MTKTWIDFNGLHIEDPELKRKMERVTASATLVAGMLDGCPAKAVFSSRLQSEVFPNGPDSPLTRGSMFHRVMELYYGVPESKRGHHLNKAILNAAARKALSEDDTGFTQDGAAMHWLRDTMDDYIAMSKDCVDVDLAKFIDDRGREGNGLELPVSGVIGEASRKTFGKIDRLISVDPDDPRKVIIDDYKTGRKAEEYNLAKNPYSDFGYVRQQTMYAILMENDHRTYEDGFDVQGARLIYPIPNKVLLVDPKNEKYRKKTIADVTTASRMLDDAAENNSYACVPSPLCSWCPLVSICAKANKDPRPKFVEARAKQPEPEVLGKVVEKG